MERFIVLVVSLALRPVFGFSPRHPNQQGEQEGYCQYYPGSDSLSHPSPGDQGTLPFPELSRSVILLSGLPFARYGVSFCSFFVLFRRSVLPKLRCSSVVGWLLQVYPGFMPPRVPPQVPPIRFPHRFSLGSRNSRSLLLMFKMFRSICLVPGFRWGLGVPATLSRLFGLWLPVLLGRVVLLGLCSPFCSCYLSLRYLLRGRVPLLLVPCTFPGRCWARLAPVCYVGRCLLCV